MSGFLPRKNFAAKDAFSVSEGLQKISTFEETRGEKERETPNFRGAVNGCVCVEK